MSNKKLVEGLTEDEMTAKVNEFVHTHGPKLDELYSDAMNEWMDYLKAEEGSSKVDLSILLGILHTAVLVGIRTASHMAKALPLDGEELQDAFIDTVEQAAKYVARRDLVDEPSDIMAQLKDALQELGKDIGGGTSTKKPGGSDLGNKKTVH